MEVSGTDIDQSHQEPSAGPSTVPTTNVLSDAIRRVRDLNATLGATLEREVDALRESRSFGLVFERHLPEAARLVGYPIKRGVQVGLRYPTPGQENLLWRVRRLEGAGDARMAYLLRPGMAGEPPVEEIEPVPVKDLVVIREFGEPVFPGLKRVGEPIRRADTDSPNHVVINGENYHALQLLKMTHGKKVDLIYIDPPYNTGNKGWIYNDRYVAEQDGHKHAKWLSFMERRLILARDLLRPTGVIFVAVDDAEQARLKLLMDQVFGESNFIANVVWQGGHRNDAKYIATGHDYMLVYARNEPALVDAGIRWRERKAGLDEAAAAARDIWKSAGGDHAAATKEWRAWMKDFKARTGIADGVSRYTSLDETTGEPIYTGQNLSSPNPRANLQYDLLHPTTGKPVKRHPNGWRYSKEQMAALVSAGRVRFGPDETSGAQGISHLSEFETQVAKSFFSADRRRSAQALARMLGDKRFPFPKDPEVLMRWIGLAAPQDATIVDFFGGSGSTAEAAMRLNHQDGGQRQVILVTNNELAADNAAALAKQGFGPGDAEWEAKGVFEYVTRPRITTVVTGTRPDGSTYSDGLTANVDFFNLTYLDPDRVSGAREFDAIAPLLWMMAGSPPDFIATEPAQGYEVKPRYAVLTDTDATEDFLKEVVAAAEPPSLVFVVTDSPSEFEHVSGLLPYGSRPVRLYEAYLRNFLINVEVA